MPENLVIRPQLSGTTSEAPAYHPLGNGATDKVFLLGHSDALPLNTPYQVADMQDATNDLRADTRSPLYRSLLESYYAGALDIWLMAVAPMREYQADPSLRDAAYYQTYYNRLSDAYTILEDYDYAQMVCPIDAPLYDAKGVDFLTQLTAHCSRSYALTGSIRIGFIGTNIGVMTDAVVNTMVNDPRLPRLGGYGKFIGTVVGEGLFNFKELPNIYHGMLNVVAASQYATMRANQSITYMKLRNVIGYASGILTDKQAQALSNAHYNPVWRTTKGDRNVPFEVIMLADNTLGQEGSDFWSLLQVRLVAFIIEEVRRMGNRYIGTIGFGIFKKEVNDFFVNMFHQKYVKNYNLNIARNPLNINGVLVDISIQPYFGIRQLTFSVQAGPLA